MHEFDGETGSLRVVVVSPQTITMNNMWW